MAGGKVRPERTTIAGSIEIPRMLIGLWQLAGGHNAAVDIATASSCMDPLINAGLEAFDMADHYGDAELVIGHHNTHSNLACTAFTKWCPPETGVRTFENAEAAVNKALDRMNQTSIALMQYHAWNYSDDTWLSNLTHLHTLQKRGKIQLLGLTNVDAPHLQLLLDSGFNIASNQVSCSLIDRRVVRGAMSNVCLQGGVDLICYGTLLGGFLSEKWLDQPEPENIEALNWSLKKYLRFIRAAGGWDSFQTVLKAAHVVALKHRVSIPAVAIRHVLDIAPVKAVIIGSRLVQDSEAYIERNLQAFAFQLDQQDHQTISQAQESLRDLPSGCGDEYRRAPFLTAAGDLSHHIKATPVQQELASAIVAGKRVEYTTGSVWESIAGYCRAVRVGNSIHVSGTTANPAPGTGLTHVGGRSAASQTVRIMDLIENALKALGSEMKDVIRTRMMVENVKDAEEVSSAHGWRFATCEGVLPASTLVSAHLVGDDLLVEMEAWAEVGSGKKGVLTITQR